ATDEGAGCARWPPQTQPSGCDRVSKQDPPGACDSLSPHCDSVSQGCDSVSPPVSQGVTRNRKRTGTTTRSKTPPGPSGCRRSAGEGPDGRRGDDSAAKEGAGFFDLLPKRYPPLTQEVETEVSLTVVRVPPPQLA